MKKIKKLVAVMLAAIMVMAMGTSVFAADTTEYTITINNTTDGYTYVAYQIFIGDLSGSTLSNVKFGSALSDTDQESLLNYYSGGDGGTIIGGTTGYEKSAAGLAAALADKKIDAASFASKLASYTLLSGTTSTQAASGSNYTIKVTGAGYYLVDNTAVPSGDYAHSSYILEVVKSVSVDPKNTTVPTPAKTVTQSNDSSSAVSTEGKAADYDVGDYVPFTLTATMPTAYGEYKVYKLTFHDTLSTGLSFNSSSVKVYVGDTEVSTGYDVVTSGTCGCSFEVVIADTNKLYASGAADPITVSANSVIKVTYTAQLTSAAVYGETSNKVKLTYSNNPNETDGKSTGTSEEPIVYVYDFTLTVNKVDDENKALTGAGFTLYKMNSSSVYEVYNDTQASASTGSTFTFSGLDAGTYKLVETATPSGYNTVDPIEFVIVPKYDNEGKITELTIQDISGSTISGTGEAFSTSYIQGTISTTVQNKQGSTIPNTGGMGTTILYIIGAILVIGAAVLLVTRKRMAK